MNRSYPILLILFGLVRLVQAHNGAVAIAVPVEGITIDGDLSDWPAALVAYPIALTDIGLPPRDTADYQGDFRISYNRAENALYLAVQVQDESTCLPESTCLHGIKDSLWEPDSADGVKVAVDLAHGIGDSTTIIYVLQGDESWMVRPLRPQATLPLQHAQVGFQRQSGQYRGQ